MLSEVKKKLRKIDQGKSLREWDVNFIKIDSGILRELKELGEAKTEISHLEKRWLILLE